MVYYNINDPPTSQAHFMGPGMKRSDSFKNGYAYVDAKITDENHAVNSLTARDVFDFAFFTEDGAAYMNLSSSVCIRSNALPEPTTTAASCTIGADGYARYYSVGESAAGMTMTVELPKDAAYAEYDENDVCVDFTALTHNTSAVLPANGKVALIGNAGDVFGIALQ